MIVRTLAEIRGGVRDVAGPTWRSLRLLLAEDRMGFSLHETVIHAGTRTEMHYTNHVEAVYCVEGRGRVTTLADHRVFPVEPGTVYALDAHDRHVLEADEDLRLVCVFSPALTGRETHDANGSYPILAPKSFQPVVDRYPSRGIAPNVVMRSEPCPFGGIDAEGPLTREELVAYSLRGYVVRRSVFDRDEVSAIRRAIEDVERELGAEDPRIVIEPDSKTVRSVFGFHSMSGILARLACDGRLVDVARQVLGSEVSVHQSRINRKAGLNGREFGWHSDFETWHSEDGMPGMRALSAMVLLSPNDATNGALLFIPGSHRAFVSCVGATPTDHHVTSLRRQEYGVPDRRTLESLVHEYGVDSAIGEPGDVVFFDCNAMHASPSNLSPRPRTNAFVVFDSVLNTPRVPPTGLRPRPNHVASDGTHAPVTARYGRLAADRC